MGKRCPNGSRKNKNGECIDKSLIVRRRCPNGSRRKGKRGDCIKYVKSTQPISKVTDIDREDITAKRQTAKKAKKIAQESIRIALEATKDRKSKQAIFSQAVDIEKKARAAAKEAIAKAKAVYKEAIRIV